MNVVCRQPIADRIQPNASRVEIFSACRRMWTANESAFKIVTNELEGDEGVN